MKRGRNVVLLTAMVAVGAVLLVGLVLWLSSSDTAKTQIGDDTFEVGQAERLVARVPFLFQDLRGKDLDVWLQHTGDDPATGWVTFLAHTPGSRTCAVEWQPTARTFRDCNKRTYPADGGDLPRYATTVDDKGRVVVDFAD